ncbi:hypothetical protein, partial [Proteus mirabilis]|uniref:hypothetical protein n=1 Tax=Proteus mirabilis TaxID=584 RepID=UPI0034D4B9CC
KRSLVKVTHPVTAPDTGIVFNLRNPSIQDAVNSMKLTERLKNSSYSDALLANIRFVDSILVPDYGSLQAGGELSYFEVTDVNEFLSIFDKYLTDADANFILESIVKYSEEYSVNYRIGQITCPNSKCGKVIKKVNVDIANLLFLGSAGGKIQG